MPLPFRRILSRKAWEHSAGMFLDTSPWLWSMVARAIRGQSMGCDGRVDRPGRRHRHRDSRRPGGITPRDVCARSPVARRLGASGLCNGWTGRSSALSGRLALTPAPLAGHSVRASIKRCCPNCLVDRRQSQHPTVDPRPTPTCSTKWGIRRWFYMPLSRLTRISRHLAHRLARWTAPRQATVTFGGVRIDVDPRTDVGFSLFRHHAFEFDEILAASAMCLARFSSQEFVILDVGANIGVHSLFLARACRSARVVAFEPAPATFARLCSNIVANGLSERISQ